MRRPVSSKSFTQIGLLNELGPPWPPSANQLYTRFIKATPSNVEPVASIQIYFQRDKFVPSRGWGRSFGPKGRERGGVLGDQLGTWGSAVSSPSGVRKYEIWGNL